MERDSQAGPEQFQKHFYFFQLQIMRWNDAQLSVHQYYFLLNEHQLLLFLKRFKYLNTLCHLQI